MQLLRTYGRPAFGDACRRRIGRAAVLTAALLLAVLLGSTISAPAFTTNDVNTIFSSYNSAFYNQKGTNGYFKDTQAGNIAYFWGQAEMIESVIDSYEWNSNAISKAMVTNLLNGFMANNGSDWTWNGYNDDILWAVLAFARGGEDTGMTNYCNIAKANFDACYARAWSPNLGGGLYWLYPDNASKNACVNGPGALAAYSLYRIFGDTNYWNKATNIFAWERSVLFNPASGAIYDNIGTNGAVSTWASTYNQGTFIGAANFIGDTNDAMLAANFTMTSLTTGGVLPEYGIAGNNSGFNAIFWRWMTRFMKDRHLQGTFEPWLQLNATAAWNVRRADNLSWCQWLHPSPAGTNFHSWDCISSFEVLQAAAATQGASPLTVPADEIGYWPLDATSGTIAADASGNGNYGAVNGASWSSSGRFQGCLSFNGANSSVRIANPVDNDFSIVFWVKTTETAGTGQWYNGAGLVDGDFPGTADDFGTALVGGKFAFGVGNPDTTIVSKSTVNDGAWHQCVATRQQATGAMAIYVDGRLQASGFGNRNTLNASSSLLLGAIASGNGYFNGSLDDVKIFGRTLSSNEVSALYTSSFSPPTNAPGNVTATAGAGQVQMSWDATAGATSYDIKRSLVAGGASVLLTNVTATTFTDTNVVNNRSYYYVVSALNRAGEGPDSAVVSANASSLAAWFAADAITNLSKGGAVSSWPDLSGHGFNAVQPLIAYQPTYVAGAINGLPVVRFNAANNSCLWFYRPVQDDFTLVFVFESRQGLNSGNLYYQGAGLVNGEVSGVANDFGACLFANGSICAGTGNPDVAADSGAGYNDGRPHVVTVKRTKSTGIVVLYVDGQPVGATTGGTQSLTAPNELVMGAQQTMINFLTGDIAEVQIYNSALTDSDRLGVEKALECKYNLAGGAAPSAPAGLSLAAGNRQIALNWALLPGATSYTVWRSTNNGSSFQSAVTGLTTGSYVDTNAVSGRTNYYELTATDDCGAGASSAVASIFLPLPMLMMTFNAGALRLNWPGSATGWYLYGATNLTPPVAWRPVTYSADSNNGTFNVTLPAGPGNQFFRLVSQ